MVQARGSIAALTGLRGLGAAWVFAYHIGIHSRPFGLPSWYNNAIVSHGWIAVDLFFVLSGFVLMHSQGAYFQKVRFAQIKSFASKRFVRIYPCATVVLLLILALVLIDPGVASYQHMHRPLDFSGSAFLKTLTLTNCLARFSPGDWNQPTWSLSVELVGCVAFPWLASFVGRCRQFAPALIGAWVLLLVYVSAAIQCGRIDQNDIGNWGLVRMAFCFPAGMFLARAAELAPAEIVAWSGKLALLGAAGLILGCILPGCMCFAVPCTALLIFSLALEQGAIGRVLATAPIRWLGEISFPLYLLHVVPLNALEYHVRVAGLSGGALLLALLYYVLFCFGTAQLLHKFVEKPASGAWRRHVGAMATFEARPA